MPRNTVASVPLSDDDILMDDSAVAGPVLIDREDGEIIDTLPGNSYLPSSISFVYSHPFL